MDVRGKHEHHKNLDDDIRNRIRHHISKFPACESHYSRSKQKARKYLDSSLTIPQMHRLFLEEHLDALDLEAVGNQLSSIYEIHVWFFKAKNRGEEGKSGGGERESEEGETDERPGNGKYDRYLIFVHRSGTEEEYAEKEALLQVATSHGSDKCRVSW